MINQKRFLNKIASFNYKFMFMNLAISTLIMSPILDLMFTYSINLDTFSTKWTIFICLIAILTNLRNIKINKVKIFFCYIYFNILCKFFIFFKATRRNYHCNYIVVPTTTFYC